jgi:5'-nucleotidase
MSERRCARTMSDRPLILVTNDDGITSRGIQALAEAMSDLGETIVVAPDRNRSGVAHMISLLSPIRCREVRPGWWASEGSPTDCVYLAVVELYAQRKFSLVVSGINHGPNLSHDVHYSGTVAGAIEGTLFEISSIAVSLTDPAGGSFDRAAQFTKELGASVLKKGGLPVGLTLNVNVPGGDPRAHQMTYLGHRSYRHSVHKREDPRGYPYYWIGGMPDQPRDLPGSDCNAIAAGFISVTPMTIDTTHTRALERGPWSRIEVEGSVIEEAQPPPEGHGFDPLGDG